MMPGRKIRGFDDPVHQAQRTFRAVLHAMAHPGTVVELEALPTPDPLHEATTAVCLSLVDFETPLWIDTAQEEALAHLRFHCGCPIVTSTADATFAIVTRPTAVPALAAFNAGFDEQPEQSATLIVQVDGLRQGTGQRLRGPGINGETRLDIAGLATSFWTQLYANQALYPRGLDIILTSGRQLAALPRTTVIED